MTDADGELRKQVSKTCEGIGAGLLGEDGVDYIMQLFHTEQRKLLERFKEDSFDIPAGVGSDEDYQTVVDVRKIDKELEKL